MNAKVPQGVTTPVTLTQTIGAGNSGLDLTTVTGVTLNVLEPDATTTQTWSASITSSTSPTAQGGSTLVWSYTFTGTEIQSGAQIGTWLIAAKLTVPSGTVPCPARPLQVVSPFSQ